MYQVPGIFQMKHDLYPNLSPDNPKHARVYRFVDEYCIDLNGTQAAIRAGYAANSAHVTASQLLTNPKVQNLIAEKKAEIAERNKESQDKVLQRWKAIVDHDPREITTYRRRCCRYCWGTDSAYQETRAEYDERMRLHIAETARAEEKDKELPVWNDSIELGFNGTLKPNPNCTECWGEGIGAAHYQCLDNLSPEALMALDGVKKSKDGIEIKTISRKDALEALSRHVGFYENSNDGGVIDVPLDLETMDEMYWQAMQRARAKQREVLVRRGFITEEEP
jgi:phage terminase small subunit